MPLVKVIAYHLLGAKPLPDTVLTYRLLDTGEVFQGSFIPNTNIYNREKAFKKSWELCI